MLRNLIIRNIVLIDRLEFSFQPGLGVLTGETGAGKSILLDALSLAVGRRGDSGLVRKNAKKGAVSAEFELPENHPVFRQLEENDIPAVPEENLILRRTVSSHGRSKAYINDEPVSVKFLQRIGEGLVEIHGQHDDRGLLNPREHRALLDAFAEHEPLLERLAASFHAYQAARKELEDFRTELEKSRAEEEYDRHSYDEISNLDPQPDEEEKLARERTLMMQGEKAAGQLTEALKMLGEDETVDMQIRSVLRRLERLPDEMKKLLKDPIQALEKAAIEAEEGVRTLQQASEKFQYDPARLEEVEERLFALRALARKHHCQVTDLPNLAEKLKAKLDAVESGEEKLKALQEKADQKEKDFRNRAAALSKAREKAGRELDRLVKTEFAPLKLEKAKFRTRLKPLEFENWGPEGAERAEFEVSTNLGAPFGPLVKIASGGELSRFILALKVVLAKAGSAPTLIFDEVDRGVGGAVADAVGERLAQLARDAQVLVVTHSPQVAARAKGHWYVDKQEEKEKTGPKTITTVRKLDETERREEIARMLSGAKVTDKARAAADSLITGDH